MPNLAELKAAVDASHQCRDETIARLFPGADVWMWYRACDHMEGRTSCRRNDDTSRDGALAASTEIQAAHDAYVEALNAFYALRDGPDGFLGGKGA